MTDLSQLSNEQLMALYAQRRQQAAPDVSKLSDQDLVKLYQSRQKPSTGSAMAQGAAQGLTFGWSDELQGVLNAGGRGAQEPASLGTLIKGGYRMLTGQPGAQEAYLQGRNQNRAEMEAAQAAHPWAYGGGQLAGAVGTAAIPLGAASTGGSMLAQGARGLGAGAVAGALQGAGDASEAGDMAKGATVGGAVGGVVGALAPGAASLVGKVISPATVSPAASRLAAEGVDTTAGQKTGWRWLQMLENQYAQLPGLGGAAGKTLGNQREQLAQAVMKRMGVEGEAATVGARAEGKQAISDAYDALKARTSVNLADPALQKDLNDFGDWASRNMHDAEIEGAVKKVKEWARHGADMPGEWYKKLSSELGASDKPSDWQLKKILDAAFRRSVSGDDAALLAKLDQQWLSQKIINDAMGRAGADAVEAGTMTPGGLAGAARGIMGRERYGMGKGPLTQLAQDAQKSIPNLPDSGTAIRLATLKALAPGAAIGGSSYASGQDPMTSVAMALAGPRFLTSRAGQKLLTNQVAKSPAARAAIARALAAPARQTAVDRYANK